MIGETLLQKGLITQPQLDQAQHIQKRTGGTLEAVLIALGHVKRDDVFALLAQEADTTEYIDLNIFKPDPDLVRLFNYEVLGARQFVPILRQNNLLDVAVTPDTPRDIVEHEVEWVLKEPVTITYLLTSPQQIDLSIQEIFTEQLMDRAIRGLYYRRPSESAYTVMTRWQFAALIIGIVLLFVGLYFEPLRVLILLNLLINIGFMTSIIFKFVIALAGAQAERFEVVTDEEVAALDERDLPMYTVLVPVYKEANIVGLLMENLAKLDYPPHKLEILLLLEANDAETLEAVSKADLSEVVTPIIIPNAQPKTKPKACNVGLFFSKGEFLVIYDAEDRPEHDQLKKAVVAFRKGSKNLACVQAALNYFNANENFLTRMFTLEYSYWFDYMLPGLDRLRLPIPLGGTSNHFRTQVLHELGGWDPFNVTEDADLGIRASALGYTVSVINSTTYEEANAATGNWIRQRSRWIKGYMQTVLVHLRDPIGLIRSIGWRDTLGFVMLIAGTPMTFLCVPIMWAGFVFWVLSRSTALEALFPPVIMYIGLFNLLFGNALMIYLNMLAVFKRQRYGLILFAMLNPVYWMLHSIASYKALWQLFTKPFFWEKTTHGISSHLKPRSTPNS
jgi:glycosyltransferase XagB